MTTALGARTDPVPWLDDPDIVAAEFAALIEANFGAEPPGTEPEPKFPCFRNGPERPARRRELHPHSDEAPPGSGVAHERSPPG